MIWLGGAKRPALNIGEGSDMAWPKGRPRKAKRVSDEDTNPEAEGEDLTYLPGEGDPHTAKWRGHEFKAHVPKRVSDKDMIAAARGNRFYRVGNETIENAPVPAPTNAMSYRAHVVDWIRRCDTVADVIKCWALDRSLRVVCEVGQDDISFLGTLVEPKLRALRLKEGLSDMEVAGLWVRAGVLDLPWRAS